MATEHRHLLRHASLHASAQHVLFLDAVCSVLATISSVSAFLAMNENRNDAPRETANELNIPFFFKFRRLRTLLRHSSSASQHVFVAQFTKICISARI